MREDAFRAFLTACGYTDGSTASRLSRCRTVERRFGVDLDTADLCDVTLAEWSSRPQSADVGANLISSLMNAVRTYRRFRAGAPAVPIVTSNAVEVTAFRSRPDAIVQATIPALMQLYGDILDELRHRKITRTSNGPVGDYAEWLFATAYGWNLAQNSKAGYDATDSVGTRYQIKARRVDRAAGSRQLGVIRRLSDDTFDILGAVLFDRKMGVLRAALVPKAVVIQRAAFIAHVNGWRFMLTDDVWDQFGVRDVTSALRNAHQHQ